MSKLLKRETHFLHLLLSTSNEQTKALLYTLTDNQIKCISEISLNLLHLKLKPKIRALVNKSKKNLVKLAGKTLNNKKKLQIIIKNMKKLINIFIAISPFLKKII